MSSYLGFTSRSVVTVGGLLAGMLGVVACSDSVECVASYKDLGGPEQPCVITSTTGGEAAACYEPAQVCPDLSPVAFCSRVRGSTVAVNVLINNRGETPMKISAIKVRGDTRCAFRRAQFAPMVGSTIEPRSSLVMRFQYVAPMEVGEDHAVIEVVSDAENFPTLPIAVCGQTVNAGAPGGMCLQCQDRRQAEYTDCFEQP
jgi:hypothetical protein